MSHQDITIDAALVRMVVEDRDPEFVSHIGYGPVNCGNPRCPDGCHMISIMVGLPTGDVVSYRLEPQLAEQMGKKLLELAVSQQAERNKRAN